MQIFDYDNILLLPRKCRVESRSECDASVTLASHSERLSTRHLRGSKRILS